MVRSFRIQTDQTDEDLFNNEILDEEEEDDTAQESHMEEIISITQLLTEIDNDMDNEAIDKAVKEFSGYTDYSDWTGIPRCFHALGSMTSLVSKYDNWSQRFRISDYLISCFGTLKESIICHAYDYIEAREKGEKTPVNVELTKATTMFVILVSRLTIQIQLYVCKRQRETVGNSRKGRGQANVDEEITGWLDVQRHRMVNSLCELLQIEVNVNGKDYKNCVEFVFKPDVVDPMFLKLLANTAFGLMEDPDCLRYTNQGWIEKFLKILKILCTDFRMTDDISKGLLEKSMSLEYLKDSSASTYPFIVPLVNLGRERENSIINVLKPLFERMTIYCCQMTKYELSSMKPLCLLIQSIGEKLPDMIICNLIDVFALLDSDFPVIRSSGLMVICEALKSETLSAKSCKKFDIRRKQRDFIFRKIMSHFRDPIAQIRTKTINLITKLMDENPIIPLEIQCCGLITLMGDRLKDKSVMVRKSAIQFLANFLDYNAFGHDFDRHVIEDKLKQLIREKKLMRNPQNTVVEDIDARFSARSAGIRVHVSKQIEAYINGNMIDEEISVSNFELALDNLLVDPSSSVIIITTFYNNNNLIPSIDNTDNVENQTTVLTDWLFQKIKTDYTFREVSSHNANDESRVVDNQRMDDYLAKQEEVQKAIEFCKNKLLVEMELKDTVDYALRCVLNGEISEMREGIRYLAKCKQFNIRGSEDAIRAMCSLVWRNSAEIRKELLLAANNMFVSQYLNGSEKELVRENSTVSNLMNAFKDISEKDRTCVEEVVYLLAEENAFSKNVVVKLWDIASSIDRDEKYRIDALRIIHAISRSENCVTESRHRLRTLQKMLSLQTPLAYEAMRVISVLNYCRNKSKPATIGQPVFRVSNDDTIFQSIEQLLLREVLRDTEDNNWFGIVQTAIDIALNVAREANEMLPRFTALLLARKRRIDEFYLAYKKFSESSSGDRKALTTQRRDYWAKMWYLVTERVIVFAGECAVRLYALLQLSVPRIYMDYDEKIRKAKSANASGVIEEPPRLLTDMEMQICNGAGLFQVNTDGTQGEADNIVGRNIQFISEVKLMKPKRLLGRLFPLVVYAVRAKGMPTRIRAAAALAFGKFMTLSTALSETGAPMFFSLMSRGPHPLFRANMLAACSDFAFAQPNLFEMYSINLYKMSQDVDAAARESAILVLSHLVSNDMIQIRGALSEPARCLCDDVLAVQSIAASFFTDLNRRSDSLLNLLPDFILRLASSAERVPFEHYQRIFDVLILLVKDKSKGVVDHLIERVCSKFSALNDVIGRDKDAPKFVSYALSKFTLTDTGFIKLKECIRHWSKFLNHGIVAADIKEMLITLLRSTKNEEIKHEVEQLMARIDKIQKEGLTNDVVTPFVPPTKKAVRNRKPAANKTQPARKRKQRSESDSD